MARSRLQNGQRQRAARCALYPGNQKPVVLSGPFCGLKYFDAPVWGPIVPKWLGTYECELHDTVERLIASGPRRVVDVGCAEGYYAVGMAERLPKCHVYAHDTDPFARWFTRSLARLNGVGGRVHTAGLFSWAGWSVESSDAFIFDIEGAELELLDGNAAARLRRNWLLVETHRRADVGLSPREVSDRIAGKFSGSHRIERIEPKERMEEDLPPGAGQGKDSAFWIEAINERRAHGSEWLFMEPLSPGAA